MTVASSIGSYEHDEQETTRPSLKRREPNPALLQAAIDAGVPPIAANVLASRLPSSSVDVRGFLNASIRELDSPSALKDIDKAANRIAAAIANEELIGLESDYDQDGLGAMATMRLAFQDIFLHPGDKLKSYVGHRLRDGYGLSANLAERILEDEPPPSLVITADNGSSDEERIKRLKAKGIDVIVTDHHALPPAGAPRSAYACINPQQQGCEYPDPAIAGGMVAWLLMCAVRNVLVEQGVMPASPNPLGELLDFVACSTVADCVSMASKNNRAIVKYGLRLMNTRNRACWTGMAPLLRTKEITAETIAFGIAPRVNAQTRLNSADDALEFLLATEQGTARRLAEVLDGHNQERKAIEKTMVESAIEIAERRVACGYASVVGLLDDGHPGVQGICSARISERYGRPAFMFCPNADDPSMITGSGRSIEGVNLKAMLDEVNLHEPTLLVKYGGHTGAAGATIRRSDFEVFSTSFNAAISKLAPEIDFGPTVKSDGELEEHELSLHTLEILKALEPTGRGFEAASFDGVFTVKAIKPVGDGTHLKLALVTGSTLLNAIWFKARREASEPMPVTTGEQYRFVYRLTENNYGGSKLELIVENVVDLDQEQTAAQ